MSKEWYASRNEEDWTNAEGPYGSEDEAINHGGGDLDRESGETFYTGYKSPFEPYISGERFRDRIAEQAWDHVGEHAGDWPEATKAQTEQLGERLKETFLGWIKEHGLEPGFFAIDGIQSHTWTPPESD